MEQLVPGGARQDGVHHGRPPLEHPRRETPHPCRRPPAAHRHRATAAPAALTAPGAHGTVGVDHEDRRTAVSTVDSVRVFPKRDFPDAPVHGATDRAEPRLLTCGGRLGPPHRMSGRHRGVHSPECGSVTQYDLGRPRVCWAT